VKVGRADASAHEEEEEGKEEDANEQPSSLTHTEREREREQCCNLLSHEFFFALLLLQFCTRPPTSVERVVGA